MPVNECSQHSPQTPTEGDLAMTKCSASGDGWECNRPCGVRKDGKPNLCSGHYEQERLGRPLKPLRRHKLSQVNCYDPDRLINEVQQGYRKCLDCGVVKPLDAYPKMARNPDGCAPICRACRADHRLDKVHGAGASEWKRKRLDEQGGVCARCGTDKPWNKQGWQLDHDHTTGAWRDVLCHHCNIALGQVERRGVEWLLAFAKSVQER